MTQATIELTAAIIGLIAVTIPLVRSLIKWAHGKGILKLIFVLTLNALATACYLIAIWGITRFPASVVLWLLLAYVVFAFFGFGFSTGQPGRFEIAFFVVQIGVAIALLEIGIFRPLPTPSPPPATTISPTPSSN